RNLADRSALADAGVVDQDVDVPGVRLRDVEGIEQIQPLDPHGGQAELLALAPQGRHLRGDLRGGDHMMAVSRHPALRRIARRAVDQPSTISVTRPCRTTRSRSSRWAPGGKRSARSRRTKQAAPAEGVSGT